jgi:hypothetical protein
MTSMLRIFNKGRSDKIDYIDSILNDERPSNEEINKQFEALLTELGVVGPKKDEMLQWPSYKKWDLINQSKLKQEFDKTKAANKTRTKRSVVDTPEFYVTALKTRPDGSTLKGLRVCVGSNMVSWLQQFLQLGGLEVLLSLLNGLETKPKKSTKDLYVIYECVQCIKAVMNNDTGMLHAVETPKTIFTVCLVLSLSQLDLFSGSIDPQKKTNNDFERFFLVKTITAAMDILAAVALLAPDGHRFVLDALNNYSVTMREKRFLVIVRCLVNGMKNARSSAANEDFFQYLVSCMVLVNIIVNGPDELRIRSLLRNEFFQLGLEGMLKELAKLKSEELRAQIETFNGVMADDYAEMEERFLDMNSEVPLDMARKIIQNMNKSTGYKFFLSILHNLYIIASKPEDLAVRVLRVFEDMTNRVMMKEFPGDLEMDKAYLQSIVGIEHKISRPGGLARSNSSAIIKPEQRLNRKASVRDINDSGSSLSLSQFNLDVGGSSFFRRELSGSGGLPPAPSPPPSPSAAHSTIPPTQATRNARETLLDASRESMMNARISTPPSPNPAMFGTAPFPDQEDSPQDDTQAQELNKRASMQVSPGTVRKMTIAVTEVNNGAGADLLGGAPIPPPPKGGAPIPPPPPGAGPPPPPLGSMSKAAFLPKKKIVTPNVRMKQFHWRKVPENKLADTFWLKVQDVPLGEDFKTLELNFCAKEDVIKQAMDEDSGITKPNVIHLLDRKRSDNISIVLSHLKMSATEIKYAILDMDEEKIDSVILDQMIRFMPTKEEEELIRNCPYADQPYLDKPEQYAFELLSIPSIGLKLESWLFKRNFKSSFADIVPSITAMQAAMKNLQSSVPFTKLMEIILTIGNFLNGARGVVYGFKFDCLLRLRDTKTVDNKSTLLHFLADLLHSKYPEVFNFYSSIQGIEEARKVNLQNLRADLATLRKGFTTLNATLNEITPDDKFYHEFSSFKALAHAKFQKAEKNLEEAESNFSKILTFYGEDQVNSEDFFGILYRFHTALHAAYDENTRKKESEQRAAIMAEKRRLAKSKSKETDGETMGESGLDDIVNALHKNNLLRIRRDNQRAGVPPPPELQAVLQLRKNLKRSSFYSKQGIGNGMSEPTQSEPVWGSESAAQEPPFSPPLNAQTIDEFRPRSPSTSSTPHEEETPSPAPRHRPTLSVKPLPAPPEPTRSPRYSLEVPSPAFSHVLAEEGAPASPRERARTVASRVGSMLAPPPPPVSEPFEEEALEDVHIQENMFVQNSRKTRESRSRMVMYAGNISLNMDLVKMRGASLLSFEEGKPILLKIRSIMPYVEKAKAVLTTPVQVDRSSLNRTSDDKLVKVQSAIEVFTTEIQMIMSSLSDVSEALSDSDVDMVVEQLQKVDELSEISQLD